MKKQTLLTMSMLSISALQAAEKPNVVMVITDEHNFKTIEAYLPLLGEAQRHPWGEQAAALHTPNLNFLAQNGVIMENCYATTPVSTPSRSSIMSGMYPQKTNCTMNDIALDRSLKTIAQCFGENGYDTGYVGKWHLSGSPKPGWLPQPNYGWEDNFYMFNRGHYKTMKENLPQHPMYDYSLINKPGWILTTDFLTDKAIDIINKERQKPFFLCLSIPDPHGPNVAGTEYYNQFKDVVFEKPATAKKNMSDYPTWAKGNVTLTQNDMRNYWGMVKCVDDNIGRLIDNLRNKGLLDNTIIMFTSDHGDMCGEHGREDKSIPLESSMKVPFIIYAPNILPQGKVVHETISNIDIYPTLADLCGLQGVPETDGITVAPLMKGQTEGYTARNCAFSRGTGGPDTGWIAVTTDRYKLVISTQESDDPWLLDRVADPDELINYYTDPAYAEVVTDLTARLVNYCEVHHDSKFQNLHVREGLGLTDEGGDKPVETGNILVNSDFENTHSVDGREVPYDWEITATPANAVSVGSNGIQHSMSLKLGLAGTATSCTVRQSFEVEPGQTYTFNGYCYYSAKPTNGKLARIRVVDAEERLLTTFEIPATGTFGGTPNAADKTIMRSFDFVPTMTVASLILENNGIDKLIRFDHLSVTKKSSSTGISTPSAETVDTSACLDVDNHRLMLLGRAVSAEIYTPNGQKVSPLILSDKTVDLHDYPAGILLVRVLTVDGQYFVKKIINS